MSTIAAVSTVMNTHTDVALFLWNPDVIQLISWLLDDRNIRSCGFEPSEGLEAMQALIESRSPSVVVFDLMPPYDRSAAVAQRLHDRCPNAPFVFTCADTVLAVKKAPWLSDALLFQKPYDVFAIADAVQLMAYPAQKGIAAMCSNL